MGFLCTACDDDDDDDVAVFAQLWLLAVFCLHGGFNLGVTLTECGCCDGVGLVPSV